MVLIISTPGKILCINLTLWESDPLQTVYPNKLNRLKKVGKVHRLKSQPMFSVKASQTEWREPFDFPTRISGFPM